MTVHVVIVTKKDCEQNVYVYKNREDAIKQFCYYQMLGEKVVLEEAEVR